MSKVPRLLPAPTVALLMTTISVGALPMAAQEQRELPHGGIVEWAYVHFDFNAENKRAPKKVRTVLVLPRDTGIWDWCLFGFNTANQEGSFKYVLEGYGAVADSPFVFGPRFFRDKGSVKVESRESTAYGDTCFRLTFGSSSDYTIHTVTVTTKSTRKLSRGSYGQWGFSAIPGQESLAGLQSKGLANVSVAVANGALAFPD